MRRIPGFGARLANRGGAGETIPARWRSSGMTDHKPVLTATEARQGQPVNMTRWVLIGGLCLVIPAFAIAWYFLAY
jgi:hypothetical protein